MLDHGQAVAGNRLRFSDQARGVKSKNGSGGDSEFDFWGGKNLSHEQVKDELQIQCEADTEGFRANSPSLCKSRNSTEYEFSHLLPYNYQFSNLSPRTRSEAIAEGRRELMEMIRDMPESNYELSLKDIVDEGKTLEEVKEEMFIDKRSSGFETEGQIKTQNNKAKKKSSESGGFTRSGSMYNEIFLIKMFFPRSLGSKKKLNSKNCSRVSPRTSFERSANHHDEEQWIEGMSLKEENEAGRKNCSQSNTNREVEVNNLAPGCWPILHTKKSKSKSRGQRGCLF